MMRRLFQAALFASAALAAGCAGRPGAGCLDMGPGRGRLLPLELRPARVYGVALSYAGHARETGSLFRPPEGPAVFRKSPASVNAGGPARMPSRADLLAALERLEPGLGHRADRAFPRLAPLLDYEAELAFVLLDDVDWARIDEPAYAPRLGFFVANDLSARAVAVLGEGRPDRYDYWGVSKSFPGFLPVGRSMWVPAEPSLDAVPCVTLTAVVNGETRQRETTGRILYTPRAMLKAAAAAFPRNPPGRGDAVLTGTPGGVALRVPAWKTALANLLRLDRFRRLASVLGTAERSGLFLSPGDDVTVSAGPLGSVTTRIVR